MIIRKLLRRHCLPCVALRAGVHSRPGFHRLPVQLRALNSPRVVSGVTLCRMPWRYILADKEHDTISSFRGRVDSSEGHCSKPNLD